MWERNKNHSKLTSKVGNAKQCYRIVMLMQRNPLLSNAVGVKSFLMFLHLIRISKIPNVCPSFSTYFFRLT